MNSNATALIDAAFVARLLDSGEERAPFAASAANHATVLPDGTFNEVTAYGLDAHDATAETAADC
jgi:hypothetical protein